MSAFILNVTFDCADPELLASFWAAVTGYQRTQESSEEVVVLQAPDQRGVRRLLFYRVPEPKTVKNRMHVDLASREPEAEIERLLALGAARVEHHESGLGTWTVMRDPEGNEFCIG